MALHVEEYNPWWMGEVDPLYEEWLSLRVKWVPRVVRKIPLKPYSLHFLVGPRQVGKTTALKILIYRLLESRDPRSIFYYSCDELSDYRELGEVLDDYLSARRAWGVKSSIIILDEITFVEEWYRALKSRIDRRLFRSDVLIVTGSASLELVAGRERFPGRRGYGRDIYMYPMSFGEYVEHFAQVALERAGLEEPEEFESCMSGNAAFRETLGRLFTAYLATGGYPVPIREYFEAGRVTYASYKVYLDWLRTDWLKAGRGEGYMKEVVAYLLETATAPLSWYTIAKNTSISSPHTAREYVETLELLMVARVVYWASPWGEVNYRKNKKVLFTDPFIYRALSAYTRVEVEEPAVVEATVTTHLARRYPTYYWSNKTEVDALVLVSGKPLGFEVKWRRKHRPGRKPLKTCVLGREDIPVFLATLNL